MSQSLEELKEQLTGASLETHRWGIVRAYSTRESSEAAKVHGASARLTTHKKKLINDNHPAWKKITSIFSATYTWWQYNSYPWSVEGIRLILRERKEELWDGVSQASKDLAEAIKEMDGKRDEIMQMAKEDLGVLYDASLYPQSWRGEFSLEPRERNIEPPEYLRFKDADAYQQELQRTLGDIKQSMQAFERQCFSEIARVSGNLISNLQPGERVMSSNVESFQKLMNRVSQMRFEGTAIFKRAMEEAQEIIEGIDVVEARKSRKVRNDSREKLEKLIGRYKQLQEAMKNKHQEQVA